MKEKLIEYWKKENKLYDDYPMYCHYSTQKLLNKYIKNVKKKKVLEIGCGHGAMLDYFKERGAFVKGIDINPEAVFYCKSRGIDAIQADCRNIPFKDNSFDVVFSLGVVEHFPETIKSMKEHVRLCKPNGKIIIIVPHFISLSYFGAVLWHYWRWGLNYNIMTTTGKAYFNEQFRKMMLNSNCKNPKVFSYFGSAPLKILTKSVNKKIADFIENSYYSKNFGHLLFGISTK